MFNRDRGPAEFIEVVLYRGRGYRDNRGGRANIPIYGPTN